MIRSIAAMCCFATWTTSMSSQYKQKRVVELEASDDKWCGPAVDRAFKNASVVFRSNPARLLQDPKSVSLRDSNGTQCVFTRDSSKGNAHLVIDEQFESVAECCHLGERNGMGSDDNGNLFPFAAKAISNMDVLHIAGMNYTQIQPSKCPAGGCPLVVEIPGHGGEAWLMVRYSCSLCRSQLGVVIVSPDVGEEEDTGLAWVRSMFIPFVRAFLVHYPALVDKSRVYLVTASRGNEIGLTAALAAPDLWSYAVMAGKFKFTADMWDLMETHNIFQKTHAAGLQKLDFNIGDVDPIIPDEEFYANFSAFLGRVTASGWDATHVVLYIYPGYEHDTGPGVWSQRSKVIWEGTDAP